MLKYNSLRHLTNNTISLALISVLSMFKGIFRKELKAMNTHVKTYDFNIILLLELLYG